MINIDIKKIWFFLNQQIEIRISNFIIFVEILIYLIIDDFLITKNIFKVIFSDNGLGLIKVLIWPVTIVVIFTLFNKIMVYMFLSMKEYNFFGIKGEIKDPQIVIKEMAEKIYRDRVQNEDIEKDKKDRLDEVEKIKTSKQNEVSKNLELLNLLENRDKIILSYEKEINELKETNKTIADKAVDNLINNLVKNYNIVKKVPPKEQVLADAKDN